METTTEVKKKTVLVVEDEDSLRMAMSLIFKAGGYRVLQAANGTEAYEIIKSESLDVIVSDVRMPNGDGISLLQKVRALHHEKPLLLLVTGYTDLKNEDAYDMGADAVFPKPFDRQLLLETIKEKLLIPEERWLQEHKIDFTDNIKVQLRVESLDSELNGQVLKIGRGGFFAALDKDFPLENSVVAFSIESLNNPTALFEGVGAVRWVRHRPQNNLPSGCGIEFKNINSSSLNLMLAFIAAQKIKALIPKG